MSTLQFFFFLWEVMGESSVSSAASRSNDWALTIKLKFIVKFISYNDCIYFIIWLWGMIVIIEN